MVSIRLKPAEIEVLRRAAVKLYAWGAIKSPSVSAVIKLSAQKTVIEWLDHEKKIEEHNKLERAKAAAEVDEKDFVREVKPAERKVAAPQA